MPNKDKTIEDIANSLVDEASTEIYQSSVGDELGYRELLDGHSDIIDEGISDNFGELPSEEYNSLWSQIFDKALGMLTEVKTADQNLDNDAQDMGPGRFDYQPKVKPEDLIKESEEDSIVPMPTIQHDMEDMSGKEQFPGQSFDFTNPREGDTKYTYSNESPKNGRKKYNITYGVGEAKYVVSYYDGVKKHNDGSDFYDVAIFKNKKDLESFEQDLLKKGYVYGSALSANAKHTYSSLTSIVQSMENAIAGGSARIPYTKREGNWAYTLDKDYILHITYFATEVITADFNNKKVLSVTTGGYGSVSTKKGITRSLAELRELGYSIPELKDYESEVKSTLKAESNYPSKYFKNPEYVEKAELFSLTDIENGDLTPEGLIAKMYVWQESEHEVEAYVYDMTKKELESAGYKMPKDIIRAEASQVEDKGKMYVHTNYGKTPLPGYEEDSYEFMFAGVQFDLAHGTEELKKKVQFWRDRGYQVIPDNDAYARIGNVISTLKIVSDFDMETALEQIKPYLGEYKSHLAMVFGATPDFLQPVSEGDELRLHWIVGKKGHLPQKALMYIGYDEGMDYYWVRTEYYNGNEEMNTEVIKDLQDIGFEQFAEPDLFFPENEIKQMLSKQAKIKTTIKGD